mgnify:CR=1 FL=1
MNKNLEQSLSDRNRPQYRFMKYRIHKILLVCCSYDGYILEEDGHIESQINQEYLDLNMSNPPSFTRVSSTREALDLLGRDDSFDFILTMYNVGEPDVFSFAKIVKERHPNTPVALLTSFSKDIYRRIEEQDRSGLDYIFSWHGNTELIIAIIKLIEDKMNAPDDTASVGVQIILLVEDSVRFYSSALPHLYKFVLEQSQMFAKEALNDHQRTLRMRGRPKIKLARTYEEAVRIFNQYRDNMLGIISDMSFMHDGERDERVLRLLGGQALFQPGLKTAGLLAFFVLVLLCKEIRGIHEGGNAGLHGCAEIEDAADERQLLRRPLLRELPRLDLALQAVLRADDNGGFLRAEHHNALDEGLPADHGLELFLRLLCVLFCHVFPFYCSAMGSRMVTTAPPPSALAMSSTPLCIVTISSQTARPMPLPRALEAPL